MVYGSGREESESIVAAFAVISIHMQRKCSIIFMDCIDAFVLVSYGWFAPSFLWAFLSAFSADHSMRKESKLNQEQQKQQLALCK